jgi:hypothetical protein
MARRRAGSRFAIAVRMSSHAVHVLRNVGDGEFEGIWFVHGHEHPVRATRSATRPRRASKRSPRIARRTVRA